MGVVYIAGGGWSWTPNAVYMSSRQAIHMLVDIVAKGGNLLYNIAPGPEGQWHDEAYKLLSAMGAWMKVNGEAIYGTRAIAPYKDNKVCISRKGDNTYYLYYMAEEGEVMPESIGMSNFNLPAGSKLEMLGVSGRLKWKNIDRGFSVSIPSKHRNNPPNKLVWVMKVTY